MSVSNMTMIRYSAGLQEEANEDTKPTHSVAEADIAITRDKPVSTADYLLDRNSLEMKEEEQSDSNNSRKEKCGIGVGAYAYTEQEDEYIRKGIARYGKSDWSLIVADPQFHFKKGRTRSGIRMKANIMGLIKKKQQDEFKKGLNSCCLIGL